MGVFSFNLTSKRLWLHCKYVGHNSPVSLPLATFVLYGLYKRLNLFAWHCQPYQRHAPALEMLIFAPFPLLLQMFYQSSLICTYVWHLWIILKKSNLYTDTLVKCWPIKTVVAGVIYCCQKLVPRKGPGTFVETTTSMLIFGISNIPDFWKSEGSSTTLKKWIKELEGNSQTRW